MLVGALLVYGQAYLGMAGVAIVFDLLVVALCIAHVVQLQPAEFHFYQRE
jgi:hypothetical protein